MEISDWTLWAVAMIVALNTLFIAGIAVGLILLHRTLDRALRDAGPVLRQTAETLQRVEGATRDVQVRLDSILERTSTVINRVSDRVDHTAAAAEEVVRQPLIGAASVMAGINEGLRVYAARGSGEQPKEQSDGRDT